jgi:secernin
MCDTIVAPLAATAEHVMLFGKNSDRQRNEAQLIEYTPRTEHPSDALRACTYISVPEVPRTNATLVSRPFWMWGAEMGANEHGVVIGNEALATRGPFPEEPALTGMDLLRLTLERASTAAESVSVLTNLLERHGQGGNCGHLDRRYYHNGYLIADPKEAYVVETVAREWLVKRLAGACAISNLYSIGSDAIQASGGMPEVLRSLGWTLPKAPHCAEILNDPAREHIGHAGARRARATALLEAEQGRLSVAKMIRILRDHGSVESDGIGWTPETARRPTLCMHAGEQLHSGQTTSSWVAELHRQDAVHWVTASAAPCISIYKPLFMDVALPPLGPALTDRFDRETLWWRHEQIHRAAVSRNFTQFIEDTQTERDGLEASFQERVKHVMAGGNLTDRSRLVEECWKEAGETEARWLARLEAMRPSVTDNAYHAAWSRMNEIAGLDVLR